MSLQAGILFSNCAATPLRIIWHRLTVLALIGMACHGGVVRDSSNPRSLQVANLHAFARIYGVLRWFHPSDAASMMDWDRFAIEGARRAIDAKNSSALRAILADLIRPFAPTVHIIASNELLRAEPALPPFASPNIDVVAWEHLGYGDTTLKSEYASKRRHRERTVAISGEPFVALWQAVDAVPLRGAKVRLRGRLRTSSHGLGRLWMRIDRDTQRGFFENMRERPVISATWAPAEIIGAVDMDATRLVFGPIMSGDGVVWYDDLELAVQTRGGDWKSVEVKDPGFESSEFLANWSFGTGRSAPTSIEGWKVMLDAVNPAAGAKSLRIEPTTRIETNELFSEGPEAGEVLDVDLGQGLRARVSLAIASMNGHTIGDDPEIARRSQAALPVLPLGDFDTLSGVADVIVAWNVLEHFWPYWNVVHVDWLAELDIALVNALNDRDANDHLATLQRLSAAAPDGHAATTCPGAAPRAKPPFLMDLVEGKIVVTATADKALSLGDVIISINNRPAGEILAEKEALASGSPQWRRVVACDQIGEGPEGASLSLRIRRAEALFDRTVVLGHYQLREFSYPATERLNDGVYYVDLRSASMKEINAIMERLAAAPGVVFDLRDHPNDNEEIMSHLLTRPVNFLEGMTIAHVVRPDHVPTSIAGWKAFSETMPVVPPHIGGRVAFLVGPGTISYGESLMRLVEHYHLGEIVGSATAGTNGNIAEVTEPTGCRTRFTGMRVTKINGSQNHLVGIQPTIPVSRTVAGVTAGHDEVFERALTYVRNIHQ